MQRQTVSTLVAAIIIVAAHYIGLLSPFELVVARALAPVERVLFRNSNRLHTYYTEQTDQRDLREVAQNLETENAQLRLENVTLQLLQEENEKLREALDFQERYEYRQTMANVISRNRNQESERVITLDAGSADGVAVGNPVIAANGILIGKVFQVEPGLSHAYLITDGRCEVAAMVSGSTATEGLTKGELGLTARMEFVPQEYELKEGDTIITSGLELSVPPGLIIGTVTKVTNESNDIFKTAVVAPATDLSDLTIVFIITNE